MKTIRRIPLVLLAALCTEFATAGEAVPAPGGEKPETEERAVVSAIASYLTALKDVDLEEARGLRAVFPDGDGARLLPKIDSDLRMVQSGLQIPEGEISKVSGDCAVVMLKNLGPGTPSAEAGLLRQEGKWKVLGLGGIAIASRALNPEQKKRFDGLRGWTRDMVRVFNNENALAKLSAEIAADPGGKRGQAAAGKKRFAEALLQSDPNVWLDLDTPDGLIRQMMEFEMKEGVEMRLAGAEMRLGMAETRALQAEANAELAESMVPLLGEKQNAVAEAELRVAEAERKVAEAETAVREALEKLRIAKERADAAAAEGALGSPDPPGR